MPDEDLDPGAMAIPGEALIFLLLGCYIVFLACEHYKVTEGPWPVLGCLGWTVFWGLLLNFVTIEPLWGYAGIVVFFLAAMWGRYDRNEREKNSIWKRGAISKPIDHRLCQEIGRLGREHKKTSCGLLHRGGHDRLNNKRLKVGDIKSEDGTITADIVTVDNSLVQRLKVDRHTGAIEYPELMHAWRRRGA